MASLIDPENLSVQELKRALVDIDDEDKLDAILEAELSGKDRKTAKEAIEQRRAAVENDRVEQAPDRRDEDSEDDVGADEVTPDEPNESPRDGDNPTDAESDQGDTTVADGAVDADAAALGTLDLAAKQAEVLEGLERDEDINYRILEDLDDIRSAIDASTNKGGRVEAQIRHLHEEVNELKAYTNALEEFIGEEGTGRQMIESVRGDLETIESDLIDIRTDIYHHGQNIAELWGVLSNIETALSQHDDRLDRQREDFDGFVADMDEELQTVIDTLDEHTEELAGLDGQLATVTDRVDTLAQEITGVKAEMAERFDSQAEERADLISRVEDNAAGIGDLGDKVDEVASVVDSNEHLLGDAGPIEQRFADIEADLESLLEWRQQLGSVLTGTGGEPEVAPEE